MIQFAVFIGLTSLVAFMTYLICRNQKRGHTSRDYFLANGGLSWWYVAGSILLTNISAEQIVGMNGPQALLVAWWELYAAIGLFVLAKVFIPLYYKLKCTTTAEFLEKRTGDVGIRVIVSTLFLIGYTFILLPSILYTGSLFMKSMFNLDLSILTIATLFTIVGTCYAVFGGLRAIAVSDTFNGIGLIIMGTIVTTLALFAIDFDFSEIPITRLTLIGDEFSQIPWPTLFTGMFFIQVFYWASNMIIAQRAMAAKSVGEAQKGIYVAIGLKLFIPFIVVLPGIISFKLYGPIGDVAYGRLVADVLPDWLSGAFAAVIVGAVLSSFNSCLNSGAALYTCDIHQRLINPNLDVAKFGKALAIIIACIAVVLVPIYESSQSINETVQQLNGLYSMPVLSAFLIAYFGIKLHPLALRGGILFGIGLYFVFTFLWTPIHYIHLMAVTLISIFAVMYALNWFLNSQHETQKVELAIDTATDR